MLLEIGLGTLAICGLGVAGLTAWTFTQKKHSGPRIYGPLYPGRLAEELRLKFSQYIYSPGDGPFSLETRNWVYRASKNISTYKGFGATKDLQKKGVVFLVPAPFGLTKDELPDDSFSCAIGKDKSKPLFVSRYPIWCSAMSFGALGATATRALSDGVAILGEGAIDNSGEGGLSIHHVPVNPEGELYRKALNKRVKSLGRDYTFRFDRTATSDGKTAKVQLDLGRYRLSGQGELQRQTNWEQEGTSELQRNVIIQLGPSMSGFRDKNGDVDWKWLNFVCGLTFVKGVEIKVNQGSDPNQGETISARKLTEEIAALRGIPLDEDYYGPERLPFVGNTSINLQVKHLSLFISKLRNLESFKKQNMIIGLKTTYCGGSLASALSAIIKNNKGPDYIQVDGSEGGTGSADTIVTDRVGFHTFHGIQAYDRILSKSGGREKVTLIASGRLVDPGVAVLAMCSGADMVASARGPMMALGCIQAKECHSGYCPSGIATHNSWRLRALDPTQKSVRYANYILNFRSTLVNLARITGVNIRDGEKFSRKNTWTSQ